ncbi:hypothetical protein SETIT_1G233900v2 [Setaria italica]|uniref:Uncharacterized protein n=1 Tax=Setaria italica TaxID=4555 RepID=A0A368PNS2_SETIT|nr:hypothetical protein SETIT_1G233900v2 [Setaria italica]
MRFPDTLLVGVCFFLQRNERFIEAYTKALQTSTRIKSGASTKYIRLYLSLVAMQDVPTRACGYVRRPRHDRVSTGDSRHLLCMCAVICRRQTLAFKKRGV